MLGRGAGQVRATKNPAARKMIELLALLTGSTTLRPPHCRCTRVSASLAS
jgi:hypothetical protein